MSVQGITVIVTLISAGANCLENKMATSSVEEKQLVVEGMIYGLSSDELKNLADHLEIPVMQYVGKSKLLISKLVRDKLYEEVGDRSTEADRLTFLGGIENFICGEPPSLEPVGKPKETNESPAQGKKNNSSYVDVDKVFRREFKIKGQIGAPGEENKLSFISLARQIESGLERGYPETEIIEAVIRAVGPGIALRSYLEATPGITLAKLRQILRSYFRENSATKQAAKNKHLYDRRVNTSQLEPGDRVLVRNLSQRGGPGKLRSHWEERVHVVIKQKGSLPVYEVQSEDQRGPKRRLHRNLLLPCELLPLEIPVPDSKESEPVTPAPVHHDPIGDADSDNSSSDSEDDQQPAQVRPVRQRRPPRRMTYDTIGTPELHRPVVATIWTVLPPVTLPWSHYRPFVLLQ